MMLSRASVSCVVFETKDEAMDHGRGGIWYEWKENSQHNFPEDVVRVWIVMPVFKNGWEMAWDTDMPNRWGAVWRLTGTREKPTLGPSLHWIETWHGWLRDGELTSC